MYLTHLPNLAHLPAQVIGCLAGACNRYPPARSGQRKLPATPRQNRPAGPGAPRQTSSQTGPTNPAKLRPTTVHTGADLGRDLAHLPAQIGLSIVRGHLRANNPPSRTRRPAQRQPRSCLRPAAAPDRHPVLTEPSVRRLRMNPIHPGPLGQFHTLMQTHVRSRRLTTLRTVANPLPWRKPRWFDQRYEFGHWGGHIESARSGRSGARSRRRPIRGRSARPRG
jgi:hypothetical protein